MLKTVTFLTAKIERQTRGFTKARIAVVAGALTVMASFSGCASGPDGESQGFKGWWRAQAARQDAAARAAVATD